MTSTPGDQRWRIVDEFELALRRGRQHAQAVLDGAGITRVTMVRWALERCIELAPDDGAKAERRALLRTRPVMFRHVAGPASTRFAGGLVDRSDRTL